MPSYGSNDGYGRQQFGARPSTRLTDIGRRQMQSSAMASLLAEEDIDRRDQPKERSITTEQILREQQRNERQEAQERRDRTAESKRREEEEARAERRAGQDQYEAMLQQRRQQQPRAPPPPPPPQQQRLPEHFRADPWQSLQRQQQELAQREQEFRWHQQQSQLLHQQQAELERREDGLRRLQEQQQEVMRRHQQQGARPAFGPSGGGTSAGGPPPDWVAQGEEQPTNRTARETAWGRARAGETMTPERSSRESPQNAFEVRGILRNAASGQTPPASNRAQMAQLSRSTPPPSTPPRINTPPPSGRASHVRGTPLEHTYKAHVGGVKMGYSGHVPGGRDHYGSAAVAGSMDPYAAVQQRHHDAAFGSTPFPGAGHSQANKTLSRTAASSRAGYQGHKPDQHNDIGESYWSQPNAQLSALDAWTA